VLQIPARQTRTRAQPRRSFGSGLLTRFNFPLAIWNASTVSGYSR
jgi:hypothetical protein